MLVGLVLFVAVFTVHTISAFREAERKDRLLDAYLEEPPFPYTVDVVRVTRTDTDLSRILKGQLVEHLAPLQLYVDTGGSLDYWKPLYGVSGEVLFSTARSPREACESFAAQLDLTGDPCRAERADCREGVRQAGLKRDDCGRHFESGYLLTNPARATRIDDHILGSVRFKRGRYVDFGASSGLVEKPIGPEGATIIQTAVEVVEEET